MRIETLRYYGIRKLLHIEYRNETEKQKETKTVFEIES